MLWWFKTLPFTGLQRRPWGIEGKGKHGGGRVEKTKNEMQALCGGTEGIARLVLLQSIRFLPRQCKTTLQNWTLLPQRKRKKKSLLGSDGLRLQRASSFRWCLIRKQSKRSLCIYPYKIWYLWSLSYCYQKRNVAKKAWMVYQYGYPALSASRLLGLFSFHRLSFISCPS